MPTPRGSSDVNDEHDAPDTPESEASGMVYPEDDQAMQEEERQDEAEAEQAVND